MKNTYLLPVFLTFFLPSCSRYYLNCDRQSRDLSYLASSYTGAPDPGSNDDSIGEQLVITWHIPYEYVYKSVCEVDITYWDYTQKQINFVLNERLGAHRLKNLGQKFKDNKGIIAFKAVIKDPQGQVFKTWEHQLYTPIIKVSEDKVPQLDEDPVIEEDEWDWDSSI